MSLLTIIGFLYVLYIACKLTFGGLIFFVVARGAERAASLGVCLVGVVILVLDFVAINNPMIINLH